MKWNTIRQMPSTVKLTVAGPVKASSRKQSSVDLVDSVLSLIQRGTPGHCLCASWLFPDSRVLFWAGRRPFRMPGGIWDPYISLLYCMSACPSCYVHTATLLVDTAPPGTSLALCTSFTTTTSIRMEREVQQLVEMVPTILLIPSSH